MAWINRQSKPSSDFESDDAYEINPTKYANQIIQGIIDAPMKALENNKSFDEGLMTYTLGVENLELLCRANKWIGGPGDDYREQLKLKIEEIKDELKTESVVTRRDAKISRIKYELLLTRILDTRMKEGSLKV